MNAAAKTPVSVESAVSTDALVRIEITAEPLVERSGTKDGKAWAIRNQPAYLHGQNTYPERFEFSLGKLPNGAPRPPYAPGMYTLGKSSFKVSDDYKKLGFGWDLELVPLAKPF